MNTTQKYRAEVTFPAAALALPAIREAFSKFGIRHENHGQTGIAYVARNAASEGEMLDITMLLDVARVPYDHTRYAPEETRTTRTRRTADGQTVQNETAEGDKSHAVVSEAMKFIESGNIGGLVAFIRNSASVIPAPLAAAGWKPTAQTEKDLADFAKVWECLGA